MKNVRTKINEILNKTPEEVTMVEFLYLKKNLTYEMLDEFIDKTNVAVDVDGVTSDEDEAILQLLRML